MDNPKIGVIGYGYWGKNQARVLAELGVLQGVYDTDLNLVMTNITSIHLLINFWKMWMQ